MRSANLLLILTGKTASGKDTIKEALLSKYPNLKSVVTTTSRPLREGEKDGIDYHFLTKSQFEEKIKSGDFAEYVEYGGNLYGTQKAEFEAALNSNLLWKIDPSRAGEVREFISRAYPSGIARKLLEKLVVIYITISDEVVLQRLKNRGLKDQEIKKRMADDAKIWQQYQNSYDYVVENVPGKLDETLDKIIKILQNLS